MLLHRFEGIRGIQKITMKEYVLEESVAGEDIDISAPPRVSLRRGMKIDMSMIFIIPRTVSRACPRCNTETSGAENVRIKWSASLPHSWRMSLLLISTSSENRQCGMLCQMLKTNTQTNRATANKNTLKEESGPSVRPSDFHRVRLLPEQRAGGNSKRGKPSTVVSDSSNDRRLDIYRPSTPRYGNLTWFQAECESDITCPCCFDGHFMQYIDHCLNCDYGSLGKNYKTWGDRGCMRCLGT